MEDRPNLINERDEEIAQLKQKLAVYEAMLCNDSLNHTPTSNIDTLRPLVDAAAATNRFDIQKKNLEIQYRSLFDLTNDAVFFLDMEGFHIDANQQAADMLGYELNEIIGLHSTDVIVPDEQEHSILIKKRLLAGETIPVYNRRVCKKDGTTFPVEINAALIRDEAGQPLYIQSIVRDISERVRKEEALRESEIYFRTLFEYAGDAIFIEDEHDRIIDVNFAACRLLGYSREELLTLTVSDLQAPEFRGKPGTVVQKEIQEYQNKPFEKLDIRKDGTCIPVEVSTVQLKNGYRGRVMSIVRDISERKKAEAERRLLEDKFTKAFHTSPDSININRLSDGLYLDVNQGFCELTGFSPQDVIGKTSSEISIWADSKDRARLVEGLLKNGYVSNLEAPFRIKDGTLKTCLMSASVIDIENEQCILSITRDISERIKAEEKIKQHTNELARLYRASSALLLSATPDLNLLAQAIVDSVLEEFKHANCSLILVEPGEMNLKRIAAAGDYVEVVQQGVLSLRGLGLVPKAIAQAKIINEPDVLKNADYKPNWPEARSEMVIPLIIENYVMGVLDVQSREQNAFSEGDERIMALFAERAALAIHNARLFGDAKRRLERLTALRSIDQAITGNLDLNHTLTIVVRQIIQQLNVDAVSILLYQPDLQELRFIAGDGFRSQALQFTRLRLGEGYAGQAALERRTIHITELKPPQPILDSSPNLLEEGFKEYFGIPLISKGKMIGVVEIFNRSKIGADAEWLAFMETLAGQTAIAIDNIELFNKLQQTNVELVHAYDTTIEGWARALELRDMETKDHSRRVLQLTLAMAREAGLNEQDQMHVRRGALLHDIGKIGVPDEILQKPGPLTESEWEIMKLHPIAAYQLLSPIQYLRPAMDIPYCHHEKWDGSGYPRGLKGTAIPLVARIFAVVDVWDALSSDRPYRKAWSQHKIMEYIQEQSGKHFDPEIVSLFLDLFKNKHTSLS